MSDIIKQKIEAPDLVQRFTQIYSGKFGLTAQDAAAKHAVESFQFMKELTEKNLTDVTPVSAMGVYLDVISNGLSFSTTQRHVYLMSRNVKKGDGWEKRLVFSTAPDGKIFQAQRAGSIDYVSKPVMVYEGDDFALSTNERGEQIIRHHVAFPRKAEAKIIAGYVYVVFKGGRREPFWMDMAEVERLKGYSAKNNKQNGANALYSAGPGGQIDTGFFGAKLISHALKNVVRQGEGSAHEVPDDEVDLLPTPAQEAGFVPATVVESHSQEPAAIGANVLAGNEPF